MRPVEPSRAHRAVDLRQVERRDRQLPAVAPAVERDGARSRERSASGNLRGDPVEDQHAVPERERAVQARKRDAGAVERPGGPVAGLERAGEAARRRLRLDGEVDAGGRPGSVESRKVDLAGLHASVEQRLGRERREVHAGLRCHAGERGRSRDGQPVERALRRGLHAARGMRRGKIERGRRVDLVRAPRPHRQRARQRRAVRLEREVAHAVPARVAGVGERKGAKLPARLAPAPVDRAHAQAAHLDGQRRRERVRQRERRVAARRQGDGRALHFDVAHDKLAQHQGRRREAQCHVVGADVRGVVAPGDARGPDLAGERPRHALEGELPAGGLDREVERGLQGALAVHPDDRRDQQQRERDARPHAPRGDQRRTPSWRGRCGRRGGVGVHQKDTPTEK